MMAVLDDYARVFLMHTGASIPLGTVKYATVDVPNKQVVYTYTDDIVLQIPFEVMEQRYQIKNRCGIALTDISRSCTFNTSGNIATSKKKATTVKGKTGIVKSKATTSKAKTEKKAGGKIVTICYGKSESWDSREAAMQYYYECIEMSEGAERDRYLNIYMKLKAGKTICDDN